MQTYHLIADKTQTQALSALHHLIAQNDLNGQLEAFLLTCKVEELSPATLHYYRYQAGAFVRFCASMGTRVPTEVTPDHIRLFLLKLQETNNRTSINDYYRAVKRFFNWMIEEAILESNPMARIRSPKKEDKIIQPFTTQQIGDLLFLCDDRKFFGVRNKAIILTFLDTGLRLSELASIQLNDIDFDQETIKVMGKGARERVVRIGKKTQKAIPRYLLVRNDSYPCLWVNQERKPLTAWGIQVMIKNLGKRAELQGVRCSPHTFRHTFATTALKNGAGEFEVQSLLGHRDLRMTRRYAETLRSENAVLGHRRWSPVDNLLRK